MDFEILRHKCNGVTTFRGHMMSSVPCDLTAVADSGIARNLYWGGKKWGTQGDEIGKGEWGRGISLPSQLEDLGSVVSSPSEVRDGAPAKNGFGAFSAWKNTSDGNKFRILWISVTRKNDCKTNQWWWKLFKSGSQVEGQRLENRVRCCIFYFSTST